MADKPTLTPAQTQARDKAWELLCEQFDHVIIAVDTEASDDTDRLFECNWHGGITAGIGLCERSRQRLLDKSLNSDTDESL